MAQTPAANHVSWMSQSGIIESVAFISVEVVLQCFHFVVEDEFSWKCHFVVSSSRCLGSVFSGVPNDKLPPLVKTGRF